MKSGLLILLLCICTLRLAVAQGSTSYSDSLLKVLPKAHDTIKLKIYRELSTEFVRTNSDKSLEYAEKALRMSEELEDREAQANILDVMGSVYAYQGGYTQGLEFKTKALNIYKELRNKKGIAQLSNNVGVLHFRNQSYKQALAYYEDALAVAREVKNYENESTYLLNIGEVYQKLALWEKAIECENASLKISELHGIQDNRAYAYGILGQVYKAQGKFEQAIKYQKLAIKIFRFIQDYQAESEYLIRIAETYLTQRNFTEAKANVQHGLQLAVEHKSIEWQKEAYYVLSDIYAVQGDSTTAYRYHRRYAVLKDSMLNESMVKQIAQFQTLYKLSEHQARIDILTKDKITQEETIQLRTLMLYIFFAIIASVVSVVVIILRSHTRKVRDNRLLKEQKNEIQRINDDITASIAYAKRIQEAMLPTEAQMLQYLPEHFILFQPRDVVSGDFYWFQEKEGLLFLASIDCTGHGVPGAFMSMMGDALLNQIVLDKGVNHPDLILNDMHREIRKTLRQEDNENKDGMDLSLVVLDMAGKTLEFAGAHCPLILIQNGALQYIKGDRLSVGGFQPELERIFTRRIFALDVPTVFYIFSDGYQDQFGGNEKRKFSIGKLRELFLTIHTLPAKNQKEYLAEEIETWSRQGNERQVDDRLVIGVKIGF